MNSNLGIRNCHCEPKARQSIIALFLLFILIGCTDYAAQMEDDFEEWKAAQSQLDESETAVSSSNVTSSSSSWSEAIGSSSSFAKSSSSNVTPQSSSSETSVSISTMTDSRDGQIYKTVTIGTQTWMAENLNYETTNSYCYNDNVSNCTKYGRLYTWAAAMETCPSGWHLPTMAEFETLFDAVGGSSIAGKMLKSTSGWNDSGNGTDAYAFSALPAGGWYGDEGFDYEGYDACFWSSTEYGSNYAYDVYLYYYDDGASQYENLKYDGFPVRCVKDDSNTQTQSSSSIKSSSSATSSSSEEAESSSSKVTEPAVGTLTDSRDGQTYKTVTIGTQTWMAENLNYAYTGVPYDYAGSTSDSTSWCYDNDPANCAKYGRLYTWSTAMDSVGTWATNGKGCGYDFTCSPTYPVRGVCPEGWHLPTKAEFETLLYAVGGSSTAGNMLKSASGWFADYNGTDDYSFSALPVGYRYFDGLFEGEGDYARFWSSTEYGSDDAYYMDLRYINESAEMRNSSIIDGFPVRCVKD